MTPWIDYMRGADVLTVARSLGIETSAPRGASGGTIYGCPACAADTRHRRAKDKRGAIGVRGDGAGWRCHQCDVSGDAIDLVAYVLAGGRYRDLRDDGRAKVREWCVDFGGGLLPAEATAPRTEREIERPTPTYPLDHEVLALWDSCEACDVDPDVTAYLASRGIDAGRVADLDLARALPAGDVPSWARTWQTTGHRLIVPLCDASGVMRSVLARSLDRGAQRKSLAPTGYTRAGLVMACAFGLLILSTGKPAWWRRDLDLRIVIAEGEIDSLAWASQWSDAAQHAPATLGIVSGSWTPEIAARIPDGAVVVIATDADDEGEKYAGRISTSLAERSVQLTRWRAEDAA